MADLESVSTRLDALAARFEALEQRVHQNHPHEGDTLQPARHYCAVPPRPARVFDPAVSADRASAILAIGDKWVNRTNLHYFLFDSGPFAGAAAERAVVREAFDVWKDVDIGLTFTPVNLLSEAELRIGFVRGNGSWSTVGTDALTVGQQQRTMNFGWNINVPGPNGLDTAVHEIGHALGFHHEHQNPNAGIVWNEDAVYDFFRRTQTPPWSRAKTDFNILDTIDPATVGGSTWDPDSIMHYAFEAGLIHQPQQYQNGLTPAAGLSDADREVVRRFYPGDAPTRLEQLEPWRSKLLSLSAGEQKDFSVVPDETRTYNFSTFGQSDTVMVLFEEQDDDFRYVIGDDDSGFDRNASFAVRLIRGRRYQLRIRLYFSFSSGDTAVMMW